MSKKYLKVELIILNKSFKMKQLDKGDMKIQEYFLVISTFLA
jgi:hypothetical protein